MMCATADGLSYDCYDLCRSADGAGCSPYHSCADAGLPGYGLCLGECHPLRQDCPAGTKCTVDELGAPLCYAGIGSGSQCRASGVEDCPPGQFCGSAGADFDCYTFCIAYNDIGCAAGETCVGLEGTAHWGGCVAGRAVLDAARSGVR